MCLCFKNGSGRAQRWTTVSPCLSAAFAFAAAACAASFSNRREFSAILRRRSVASFSLIAASADTRAAFAA